MDEAARTLNDRISDSLYPFWHNNIPFPIVADKENLVEETTWKNHIELGEMMYKDKTPLPKGTIIFH